MDGLGGLLQMLTEDKIDSETFFRDFSAKETEEEEYWRDWYQDIMTRDCGDPDDGTPRSYEQKQKDYDYLGYHDYDQDMV